MSSALRLVLIHGFTERPSMWDELISQLNDPTIAISTPSIPGHGAHPEIPGEHTTKAYCEALLKQIPIDDLPWIVIGHSMGGYLASSLIKMVPEKIKALGFFHSKAGSDNTLKINDRRRAITAATLNKDLYLNTMLRNTLAESHAAHFQKELNGMIEAAQHDITSECIVAAHSVMIERPDNVEYLKKVRFPIYYFLGAEDKSIPYEQIEPELASIPNAHVQIIQHAGHMGQIECKAEAIEWIRTLCLV